MDIRGALKSERIAIEAFEQAAERLGKAIANRGAHMILKHLFSLMV